MKKSKQIVPICILLALVLFVFIAFTIIKGSIEEYNAASTKSLAAQQSLEEIQIQEKQAAAEKQANELQINSIKPVFPAPKGADPQTLTVFGPMFNDLANAIVKTKDLYIRSIDYKMNPQDDQLVAQYGSDYNVCAVKFFLVGTYFSFHRFLQDFTKFPFLMAITKLDISTYPDNTDYILIHLTVNLYSKNTAVKQ